MNTTQLMREIVQASEDLRSAVEQMNIEVQALGQMRQR